MGRTFKDSKSESRSKPNKKQRRDMEKLDGNARLGAYHLSKANDDTFKSSYKKLKIEE